MLTVCFFPESFVVCRSYKPPPGFTPTMCNPLLTGGTGHDWDKLEGINRKIVPFVACGDLSGYDSDRSYSLDVSI